MSVMSNSNQKNFLNFKKGYILLQNLQSRLTIFWKNLPGILFLLICYVPRILYPWFKKTKYTASWPPAHSKIKTKFLRGKFIFYMIQVPELLLKLYPNKILRDNFLTLIILPLAYHYHSETHKFWVTIVSADVLRVMDNWRTHRILIMDYIFKIVTF